MLRRRIERLERADDASGELVGVVVVDGQIEADRIAEECSRRGVTPERANLAIVRVSQHAEESLTAGCSPAEEN